MTTARPMSVTIDGRCLSASVTGTAGVVLGLVAGLRAHGGIEVRVLVLDDLHAATRARLTDLGATVRTVPEAEREGPTDVAHRPYQLGVVDDLRVLWALGRRIVVTHLDSISYRTAAHFPDAQGWHAYRELAQLTLAAADGVVLLSDDAVADAAALELIEVDRVTVIAPATDDPLGADRVGPGPGRASDPPPPGGSYLLCLGTDFAHKNRPFAIRLLAALRDAGLFDGSLVFAGPHVALGSSAQEEAAELSAHAGLAAHVRDLGAVSDTDKHALLAGAAAVVYPTSDEGFGLVPYEAARAGVPTLFAWTSALRDHLPAELALLAPTDVAASAERAAPVLVAGAARDEQVRRVAEIGAAFTTTENALRHVALYMSVRDAPRRAGAVLAVRTLALLTERDRLRHELRQTKAALAAYTADPLARGLVGPDAVVPEELRQAALAVATRPVLRRAVLAIYRAAHAVLRHPGR